MDFHAKPRTLPDKSLANYCGAEFPALDAKPVADVEVNSHIAGLQRRNRCHHGTTVIMGHQSLSSSHVNGIVAAMEFRRLICLCVILASSLALGQSKPCSGGQSAARADDAAAGRIEFHTR